MNKYEEIEVNVVIKDGVKVKYTFSKDSISHYKQYIDSPTDKKGSIITMLWLKGNPNALRLDCGYDTFKKKLGCATLDVSGLSSEEVDKLSDLAKSFQKTRR